MKSIMGTTCRGMGYRGIGSWAWNIKYGNVGYGNVGAGTSGMETSARRVRYRTDELGSLLLANLVDIIDIRNAITWR